MPGIGIGAMLAMASGLLVNVEHLFEGVYRLEVEAHFPSGIAVIIYHNLDVMMRLTTHGVEFGEEFAINTFEYTHAIEAVYEEVIHVVNIAH